MDFIKALMTDESCAVDGTASATNPVATLINKAFEGVYEGDGEVIAQISMDNGGIGEERIIVPGSVSTIDSQMQGHVGTEYDRRCGAMMTQSHFMHFRYL